MIAAVLSATSSIEVLIRTHHAEMARYSLVNLASTQSIYAHLFLIFNTKDSNRRRTKSNSTKKEKRNIWFLLFQHPWDRYYHQLRLSISSVWSNWFQILFFFSTACTAETFKCCTIVQGLMQCTFSELLNYIILNQMSAFNSVPHITRCFFLKAIFTVNAQKQNKREMVKRKKRRIWRRTKWHCRKRIKFADDGGGGLLSSSFFFFWWLTKKAKVSEALHYHRPAAYSCLSYVQRILFLYYYSLTPHTRLFTGLRISIVPASKPRSALRGKWVSCQRSISYSIWNSVNRPVWTRDASAINNNQPYVYFENEENKSSLCVSIFLF